MQAHSIGVEGTDTNGTRPLHCCRASYGTGGVANTFGFDSFMVYFNEIIDIVFALDIKRLGLGPVTIQPTALNRGTGRQDPRTSHNS
jgi:hypothetical protein